MEALSLWQDLHFNMLESQVASLVANNDFLLHRSKRSKTDSAPMILIPEKGGKQCRPAQSISSIGFLALVMSVVNAVIQVS